MKDMIDLSSVQLRNSPDIHEWPATTAITKLELRPSGVHVEFTKQNGPDRWPDVPFGKPEDHGSLQFTLWIVLNIAGEWFAAGCIEFWFGLEESGGPPQNYAATWYYDANRWAPMTGHQPAVGERVGFLITSGDARHGDEAVGLHERSNIVAVNFPDAAGGIFTFADAPAPPAPAPVPTPAPDPSPTPSPEPTPAPLPVDEFTELLRVFFDDIARIMDGVESLAGAMHSIDKRLSDIEQAGVKVRL